MSRPNPQQSTHTILVGLGNIPAPTVIVTQDNRNHHHHSMPTQQVIVPTQQTYLAPPPPAHYHSPFRDNRREYPQQHSHDSHAHGHHFRNY